MRNIFHIIAFLCSAALTTGCGRQVMDCRYTVRAVEELVKNQKPYEYSGDAKVFAYKLDAAEWEPASYEDALKGILTSKTGIGTAMPDFTGEADGTGIFEFEFAESPVMLVVCHTVYPIYGWRDSGIVNNLKEMNIPAVFRLWKYESEKEVELIKEDEVLENDGGWKMVYRLNGQIIGL